MKYIIELRGWVSKYVKNESKTAVMVVIDFLCVSLGSSTVQLHDSLPLNATKGMARLSGSAS
jgi:hypothetical protein